MNYVELFVRRPVLAWIVVGLSACGGGGGGSNSPTVDSGDTGTGTGSGSLSLAEIERYLVSHQTVDGNSIDGVWLLAQRRDLNYSSDNTATSTQESGRRTIMRTDFISIQKNSGFAQLYYCGNRSQLLVEARLQNNSSFEFVGENYFFPGRDRYQGVLVGNGTVIEFNPTRYEISTSVGAETDTESGSVTIKAYKLRSGFTNDAAGSWQHDRFSEAIVCGTYIETASSGRRTVEGVTQDFQDSEKQLIFRTSNTTVNMTETFENQKFSLFTLVEVRDSKLQESFTEPGAYTLTTLNPLQYEGTYRFTGSTPVTFSIDLR